MLACLVPLRAWAQPDTVATAKLHRDAGALFFQRGSYAEAIEQFEKARAIDPVPEDLFNIGQAERLRGDCRAALRAYGEYLKGDPEPARRQVTEMNVARCEATLRASEQPPASPRETVPPVAARPGVAPPPAPHVMRRSAPAAEPWYHDRVGGVLAGAGILGLAGSATLWVMAQGRTRSANDAEFLDDHRRLADSAASFRTGAAVVAGVSVALLGTAGYRYYSTRDSAASTTVRVGAIVRDGGGVVVLEIER